MFSRAKEIYAATIEEIPSRRLYKTERLITSAGRQVSVQGR